MSIATEQAVGADFGAFLAAEDILSAAELARAERGRRETGQPLERVLTSLGLVSERQLADALGRFLDAPVIAAGDFPDEAVLADELGRDFLEARGALPIAADDTVTLAAAGIIDEDAIAAVRFATGRPVDLRIATQSDLAAAFERYRDVLARPNGESP